MDKLEVGTVYEVRITAVDQFGNESVPTAFTFTFTEPEKETFTLKTAVNDEAMGTVTVDPKQDSYEAGDRGNSQSRGKRRISICQLDQDWY